MAEAAVGRLAFRVEGDWWVAYYARAGTMEDAVELGRIAMGIVRASAVCKDGFMAVMKDALEEFFRQRGTPIENWNEPEVASEGERSGSA